MNKTFWRRLIGISFAKKADLKTGSDEIDCYFCFACHFGERRMTVITFDTLKFANRLKQAGVPSAHAEAEAEALADILQANLGELATKADILDVKKELSSNMQHLEQKMSAQFIQLEQRMTIKLGTLMVVAVSIVATLVKLL
jgi:hypothetical protein